ncbi:MAG: outer membrane beta-barrel protein [Alphaproteobacteria bacterium]
MLIKKIAFFCTAFGSLLCSVAVVHAFDQSAVTSIKERQGQNYAPIGGRFGSFILNPSIELQQHYDDNVFRDSEDQSSDFITVVQPDFGVRSDWKRHQIRAGVSASIGRFYDNKSEDYNDYSYYVSGRYDISHGTSATLGIRQDRLHVDRSDVDDVNGDEPIEYDVTSASLGFTRALGIVKLYLTANTAELKHKNSVRAGVRVDNSIRDRRQSQLTGRVSYAVNDSYNLYTQVQYNRRRYDLSGTSFRDSDGYDYRLGGSVNLTNKMQADIYLGYLNQKYTSGFDDIKGLNFGGNILWNANEITSLRAQLDRQVVETVQVGGSGILRTQGQIAVERALKDDVIIDGYIGAANDKYEGGLTSSLNDNITYRTGFGLEYKLNRNVSADMGYDFRRRNFKNTDGNYSNHEVMLAVRYGY